jgi:DNA repair ATPase RecN
VIKLKEILKEAYIDPDDASKSINYALDDLKRQLKRVRNPEKWAEKYHRSVPDVVDMIERLVHILGKMK